MARAAGLAIASACALAVLLLGGGEVHGGYCPPAAAGYRLTEIVGEFDVQCLYGKLPPGRAIVPMVAVD